MTTNALGHYLRTHREAAGLSVRQLASRVGVDHGYLVRLEGGQKSNPSAELLYRLAEALELDNTELLSFIGIKPSTSLPSAPVYFRHKYGMSPTDAKRLAQLVDEFAASTKVKSNNKEVNP